MSQDSDYDETRLFGDAPTGAAPIPAGSTCAVGDLLARRFRIVRFIARGGMGELYEAEDLELRERVALKAMRPEIAASEDANRRFRREVQLARQVTHPNICRIFDLFQHQPSDGSAPVVFVTMELLAGETIADRIERDGPFAPEAAQPLVEQMAAALAAAHRMGIVHRDFKSNNVMLLPSTVPDEPPRVVVTDFGIAHRVGEGSMVATTKTATSEILGTPDYMAPEQLEGGAVTSAADIYALGIVMYEMLAGRRPFSRLPRAALWRNRGRAATPAARSTTPQLPETWDNAIAKCLARRPEERFSDVSSVVQALAGDRADTLNQNKRLRYVLIGAALLLVAITISVYISRARTEGPRAGDPVVAVRPAPRRSIAVLGFRNVAGRDDSAWLSTAFAEMLTTELAAGEALRTIPSDNVHRMKVELALLDADSYAGDTLQLIRANLGADVVVFGSFVTVDRADPLIRLDIRVQDARVGQMLAQVSETGTESSLLTIVSNVGRALRERLGVTPLTVGATDAVRASLPATPDAARLYAEGVSRLRRFDALAAKNLFEKAAAADPRFPMPHSALAMTWSALGYDGRARDAARRAFELSSASSREERLSVEATYREMTSEWKEAIALYQSLATFFPDNIEYALRLANAELAAGAAKDSLATVEALRAAMPEAKDPRIDLSEAAAAETLSDFKRMLAAAERAVTAGNAQSARLLVARAKLLESTAHFRLGQLPPSLAAAQEARAIYASAGDRVGVARALNTLGGAASDGGGTPKEGVALYQEGLAIARAVGHQQLVARFLNNLAIQERRAGNLDASLRLNREALAIRREIGDRTNLATSLNNIGNVLLDQGDLSGAVKHYHEAADIHREVGDRRGVARALHNAAVALRLQGELTLARSTNEEALSIRRGIDDPVSLANSLYGVADVMALQGELGPAQRLFTEALDIQRRTKGQRQIGYLLYQLADIAWLEGRLNDARKLHLESLDLRTKLGEKGTAAESQVALALLDLEEGRPAEAEARARDAYAVFEGQHAADNQATAQSVLARALLVQGERVAALREAQRARMLVRSSANALARIPVLTSAAIIDGLLGGDAQKKLATNNLRNLQREARERGIFRFELEAGIALAQLETRTSREAARIRVASLEKDARARAFGLYVRRLAAVL